ncbi:MAG: hypothetical protein JXR51_12485 [Bacteroidales bacterium]|nr:hypothetical protein [Bacteroidales bacterium]
MIERFNWKLIIFFLLIHYVQTLSAQPTRGFYIEKGNTISFHINSIDEIQHGVTSLNFARFIAFYDDDDGTIGNSNWELTFVAGAIQIVGSNPANTIDLDRVEIWANTDVANGATQNWIVLSTTETALISNGIERGAAIAMPIDISYRVGVSNTLVGSESDIYSIDLWFYIKVQ